MPRPGPPVPRAGAVLPRRHLPMRPAWLCRVCAAQWPCPPARLDLPTEFHGHSVALAFYLAAAMRDAMDDMYRLGGRPDRAAMHARFLGWLSPTRPHRTERH
ncbi:hypothetical protein HXZ27_00175 [Micromonospora carbonacea subsp. aurantiaca]|uniref:Flavin reductase n=1 Tax=Micromonospora carbonacea TaxID=47853 RepID=A0A7H8XFT2_9ACTN|nr:hypothetical protein HXZ27_00175 [Micromonospora carbonacea]